MKQKEINEIKRKIVEALDENSFYKSIKSLVPAFYSLAIMGILLDLSSNLNEKIK